MIPRCKAQDENPARGYRVALWTGLVYMWGLTAVGFWLVSHSPHDRFPWTLFAIALALVPYGLNVAYASYFPDDRKSALFITGIPGVLGAVALYLVGSFIPHFFVPPGVMNHVIGPPGPFDIIGQIMNLSPIVLWIWFFPIVGRWSVALISWLRHEPRQTT